MDDPWYEIDFTKDVRVTLEINGGNHKLVLDEDEWSDKEVTTLAGSGALVTRKKNWDDDSASYLAKPNKAGRHAVLTPFIWVIPIEKERPGDSFCSIFLRQGASSALVPYAPPGASPLTFKCDKAGKALLPVITIHLTNGRL